MKYLSPSVLGALVFLLAAGGIYAWLYIEIQSENRHVAEVSANIEAQSEEASRQDSLVRLVENTKDKRDLLATYFVGQDGVADFLKELENLGDVAKTDNEIVSVAVGALGGEVQNDHFEKLTVALTIQGSFARVMNMLSLVESLPYPVHLLQVHIEKVESKSKTQEWLASLSIAVLKMK